MTAPRVAGVGLLTGWGAGVEALPDDARAAAGTRAVIVAARPALDGDRFRRATRECLLAVAAVDAALRDAGLDAEAIRGEATALVYVTAGAYGASNRTFVEGGGGSLHFPYTAPSVVAAEVTIEYGLRGPYVTLIGGAPATLDGLRHVERLLLGGACARALVLAVETFEECGDLWARGRWLVGRPLVEAAACAIVAREDARDGVPDDVGSAPAAHRPARVAERERRADAPEGRADASEVRARAGETLACAPLVALALARARAEDAVTLSGEWRGRRARLAWDP